jgi:hypothetical protein
MTVKELIDEIRVCNTEFVTYGESDLGIPVSKEDAIADILSMDDDQIGEGTWFPCDSEGNI